MLPSKVCINFYTQVFNTFGRICLLPHSFIFKSPSSFFCLDLKITISVFFTLSEILFAFNQLTRCFKSALTSLFSFLIELLRQKISVISKVINFAKCSCLRSFIYNKNRRGTGTNPWGTPQFTVVRPEWKPFTSMYWFDQTDRI